MVAGFTTGLKVSPQSIPTCCVRPSQTKRALYRSKLPSDLNLCLKSHMLRITFMCGLRGTNFHVPFLISALYSLVMAEVNETILHSTFIPFGDIKDVKTPLDQATQKHRSFGFVTFLEREDAAAAMDNMDGAELYGRVLTVNYALPEKIKGGEQGWAAQPIWADADTWFERQQQEEGRRNLFLML